MAEKPVVSASKALKDIRSRLSDTDPWNAINVIQDHLRIGGL